MTTTQMTGMWVQWNEGRTAITAWGTATMSWVGEGTLSYSYEAGWTEGSGTPPPVDVFPPPQNVQFEFGDGSVRFIADVIDGLTNTLLLSERVADEFREAVPGEFSGTVLGVTDIEANRDYYFGLDAVLPAFEPGDLDGAVQFIGDLIGGARQVVTGDFAPGLPIPLDGTSNTILVTENDQIHGYDGRQDLFGGAGRDTIRGWDGNDVIDGGEGNDRLFGDKGNDTVQGSAGNDRVTGGGGGDLLFGGADSDSLYGGAGGDRLFGGDPRSPETATSQDDLFGGAGNDSLYGGAGDDVLDGGAGDDLLVLGGGADAIVFAQGSGQDQVMDFNTGEGDTLFLNANIAGGATTGAEVIALFSVPVIADGRVTLNFGNGDVLTLHPASLTTLADLADFIQIV